MTGPDLAADLERARSVAVSLEQELAHVAELRDRAVQALDAIAAIITRWDTAGPAPADEDPWDGVVIPKEWQDPAPRVLDEDIADHMRCACGNARTVGVTHTADQCCGSEQDGEMP